MILSSALILLGLGFAAALILAVASKILYVKEDPRVAQVESMLPGVNCGGCGYPGCSGCANAIVAGNCGPEACVVSDLEGIMAIAALMGLAVEVREPEIAFRDCTGGTRADDRFAYEGIADCRAQALLYDGSKTCPEGCLGFGSCVRACPFDAIHMGPDGLPVVDPDGCKACGKCIEICPRGVLTMTGMSAHLLHVNLTTDCLAPCRQECPGQIDIPRYIEQIKAGDYDGAVLTIKERNPLLMVCGRVCPRPCEDVCRRGHVDEPIAINMLKRFVADRELFSRVHLPVPVAKDTGRRIAVIGGGPAGLSCAYFLRRLGHSPKIFESMPALGGQLRYGIPEYRLPKADLDWEIQGILDLGIEAEMNASFGKDFTLDTLKEEGFEAVFMGLGAWLAGSMYAEGEDLKGVWGGIEFLTAHALGRKIDVGKRVIVVGGGNTAIDAARTSIRLGAEVIMMYRRTRTEMPANREEIVGAEEEGVKYKFLAAPKRVVGDDKGKVIGVEYIEMELGEPDASGRRRPEPVEGSETFMEADIVVAAIGQKPDLSCLYDESQSECMIEQTRWKTINAHPDTFQTSIPEVFAAGDVFTGPDLVISAVGDGRKAARSIHYYLTQGTIPIPENIQRELIPYTLFKTVDGVELAKRAVMPHLCHGDERTCTFSEVEGALSENEALKEADRCLRCGLICYDHQESVVSVKEKTEVGKV